MSVTLEAIDTRYGRLSVPDWPSDLILRTLRDLGEWGEAEVRLLAPLVRPEDRLWDLGAFLGTFALGLAQWTRLSGVLAVEANPDLHHHLSRNLNANLGCPFDVVAAGVGPHDGWIVPLDRDLEENHGSRAYRFSTSSQPSAIACRSLKSLRAEHGDYDVIKLDLEGMERDTLLHDQAYIKARQPVIWLECNESAESLRLFQALRYLGYEVRYLAFPAFLKDNFKKAAEFPYPMAYEAGLLAAPKDRLAAFTPELAGEDVIHCVINTQFDLRKALYYTPRWAQADWTGLSRAQLVAIVGRMQKAQFLKDFLTGQS